MSGSIVGTPIHMAPELFTGGPTHCQVHPHPHHHHHLHHLLLLLLLLLTIITIFIISSFSSFSSLSSGKYDNSVDVYAFGILFWYLCTGSVKLPEAFEKCSSKDQLWNNVKKGNAVTLIILVITLVDWLEKRVLWICFIIHLLDYIVELRLDPELLTRTNVLTVN